MKLYILPENVSIFHFILKRNKACHGWLRRLRTSPPWTSPPGHLPPDTSPRTFPPTSLSRTFPPPGLPPPPHTENIFRTIVHTALRTILSTVTMKDRPVRSSATIRSEEVQDNYSTKVAGGTIRMHKKCRLLAVSKLRTQKQRSLEVTTSAAVDSSLK